MGTGSAHAPARLRGGVVWGKKKLRMTRGSALVSGGEAQTAARSGGVRTPHHSGKFYSESFTLCLPHSTHAAQDWWGYWEPERDQEQILERFERVSFSSRVFLRLGDGIETYY